MIAPLLTLGFSLLLGHGPEPIESMSEKLSGSIVRSEYRRVGVIPRFIQREGEKETWGGTMGPQGEWLADSFNDALQSRAKGQYEVVKLSEMAQVFQNLKMTPASLADRAALKQIAQQAGGLDALIVGRAVDVREPARPGMTLGRLVRSDLTCNLIDLRSGELISSAYRELTIAPSLAAYRGEPAGTGGYSLLGTEPRILGHKGANTPNLPAPAPEAASAVGTRESGSAPSPLNVEVPALDDPRCPLPVQILVDDTPRDFIKVINPETGQRDYYVNLEPGETYQIAVRNKTDKTVYGAVYVDGINILGVKRDPDDPRVWNMAPGQDCHFRGWYMGSSGKYQEIPLIVRPASDSIAVKIGGTQEAFADRIGEIQCIFFGTEGESKSAPGEKSMMTGVYATGGGEAQGITLKEIQGPKRSNDRLLAYVIHYAPRSQIAKRQIKKD